MIPRRPHWRVRPRCEDPRFAVCEAQEARSATWMTEPIDLDARLREDAAHRVAATIGRMQHRAEEAARTTPELAPLLVAYVEAAAASLRQSTFDLLNDQWRQPPLQVMADGGGLSWRRWIRRVMPIRKREEQPDGAA